MTTATTASRFDQRYFVVLGACLTQFTVIGLLFSYGLFFKVLETEFGWSRTLLSSCTSVAFLAMGLFAIFGGRFADRYGPSRVLAVTGALYGIGYVLLSQLNEPWQLLVLYGLFVGIGLSTHDVVTLSTIARWFDKRRGMMTGVVKVGTAIGQVVMPPLAAFLILSFGWRSALIVLGIAAGLILVAAAFLVKRPVLSKTQAAQIASDGVSFADARRTRPFWTLCAIQFLFFPSLVTIPLHIVVHGMDLGMAATRAALLLSMLGACSVAGRLFVGSCVDWIGGRGGYLICLLTLTASLIAFLQVELQWALFAAVALYGFGHGGLFTVVSPTLAEYFGTRAHGSLFGIVVFFGTIGGAVGPIVAGWIFDITGSYTLAFGTLATLAGLALLLVVSLPTPKKATA